MNNKIEFSDTITTESKQFINQTSAGSSFNQNLYSKKVTYKNLNAFKVVKGKVKIYDNNEFKLVKNYGYDEEIELEIVGKRMLLFLKFTFLFLLLFSIFMLFYKN